MIELSFFKTDNCSWLKLETDADVPRIAGNRFHLLKYGYPDRPNMYMTSDNETHPLYLYLDEQHWIISDRVKKIKVQLLKHKQT